MGYVGSLRAHAIGLRWVAFFGVILAAISGMSGTTNAVPFVISLPVAWALLLLGDVLDSFARMADDASETREHTRIVADAFKHKH